MLVLWGIAQLSRDMLQNGVSHRCACVKQRTKGGGIAPFWGSAKLHQIVSRDMGYRSDSIAVSRDMGPLRYLWVGCVVLGSAALGALRFD